MLHHLPDAMVLPQSVSPKKSKPLEVIDWIVTAVARWFVNEIVAGTASYVPTRCVPKSTTERFAARRRCESNREYALRAGGVWAVEATLAFELVLRSRGAGNGCARDVKHART